MQEQHVKTKKKTRGHKDHEAKADAIVHVVLEGHVMLIVQQDN